MNPVSKLALVSLALFTSGCISLLPSPPPPPLIYSLRAAEDTSPQAATVSPLALSVAMPAAPRSIAGADIVWRLNGAIGFMERASWDGAAPDLLQSMLVETLSRSGLVRAAVRSGGGVRTDRELRWEILEFEIVEERAIEARMAATVTLVDQRTRTIVATRRFEADTPVPERSGRIAASALQAVARRLTTDIATWAAGVPSQATGPAQH